MDRILIVDYLKRIVYDHLNGRKDSFKVHFEGQVVLWKISCKVICQALLDKLANSTMWRGNQ